LGQLFERDRQAAGIQDGVKTAHSLP
jgi:hypothetical protein